MIGAIAGDIIGSVFERHNYTATDFTLFGRRNHFTDDTVLTLAIANAIMTGEDYGLKLREWYRLYPNLGYGPGFRRWAAASTGQVRPSLGNGSAMRVSPVGFAFNTLGQVLEEAKKSAFPSHGHPEGIKGAQAVASAVFLARTGAGMREIEDYIVGGFGYKLKSLEEYREHPKHDSTCAGSVPQALVAFLKSTSYEDAVRKAVSVGGDSDTIACMAGGIAEAYYGGVRDEIREKVLGMLDQKLHGIAIRFSEEFMVRRY